MAGSTKERLKRIAPRVLPWLLGGLLVYWFLPAWVWHIRRTADPFTFNDDARILIWPFLREADSGLFPNDPFVPYYLAGLPEGYLAVYRSVARLGWTLATSEVLQYVSVLSVAVLLAATARRISGTLAAFLAVALVLGAESFFERAGGGLPRSFAFPLVCGGLYALVTARPRLLAVLAIAGAAFYPVVAALLGLALLLLLVLPARLRREADATPGQGASARIPLQTWRSRLAWLGMTFVCITVLVTPMTIRLRPYGAPITPAMLSEFPEAGSGGRLTREQHPPFEALPTALVRHTRSALLGHGEPMVGRAAKWLRGTDKTKNVVLGLIVSAAALRWIVHMRRRPRLLLPFLLLLAALLGHSLACLVAPRLFLPERYIQYGVPPLVVLLVACGFGGRLTPDPAARAARPWHWASAALLLALIGTRGSSWIGIEIHVPPPERALYAAISQLPRQVVIAGWPAGPLENIPYLSARRVLTNFQLEMPFHAEFTLQSRERLRALFAAHFATTVRPIQRLCSEFDVTHFLVDSKHFQHAGQEYYAPHRAELARLLAQTDLSSALLLRFRNHPTTRHFDGDIDLIDLSQIPELAPACSVRQAP